jgi:hypothetical protein
MQRKAMVGIRLLRVTICGEGGCVILCKWWC